MKTLFMLPMFMLFTSINALASGWILWQHEFRSIGKTEQPIRLTEHKTLTACMDASKKVTDSMLSWAKSDESVERESIVRTIYPDGVGYSITDGPFIYARFRCFPYGVVPMKVDFNPSESSQ
jgi:hypothetical protein